MKRNIIIILLVLCNVVLALKLMNTQENEKIIYAKDMALRGYNSLFDLHFSAAELEFELALNILPEDENILRGFTEAKSGKSILISNFGLTPDQEYALCSEYDDGSKVKYIEHLCKSGRTNEIKAVYNSIKNPTLKKFADRVLAREKVQIK